MSTKRMLDLDEVVLPSLEPGPNQSARFIPPPPEPIVFTKRPTKQYHHGRMHATGFSNLFADRMLKTLPATEYCDVTINADKSSFKGHKVILAAYSEFFHETFLESPTEGSYLVLTLDGTSPVGLAALVDFIYTGAFKVSQSTVEQVLEVARDYKVPDITDLCEIYLTDEVGVNENNFMDMFDMAKVFILKKVVTACRPIFSSVRVCFDNYLNFLEFAKLTKSDKVYKSVFEYVIREHKRLVQAEGLLDMMDAEELTRLLMTDRHEFYTDLQLIELVVNWVEYKLEQRLQHMVKLFKIINLRVFDEQNLDYIGEMLIIKDSDECLQYIKQTKHYLRTMEKAAEINGPFLLTISDTNMELRSVKRIKQTAAERNILNLPRVPDDIKNCPGDLITRRVPFTAVLDNILFVFGLYWKGKKESQLFHDSALSCHSYDPYRNQWRELSCLHGARTGNKLVVTDGKIFSIANMTVIHQDKLNQVDAYYPSLDTWRSMTSLPYTVATPLATAASDGHIYVSFAKAWNSMYRQEFFRFNPTAETWIRRALVPKLVDYHDLASCGGRVYMFGSTWSNPAGPTDSGFLRADCYQPKTDQWTRIQTKRFGLFTNLNALHIKDSIIAVADYKDRKKRGAEAERTGIFRFDPNMNDFLIERECKPFDRDRVSSALIFVPSKTLNQIKTGAKMK